MGLYSLGTLVPMVDASVYIALSATVIGQVSLGCNASVWPGAAICADNEPIHIGARTNVQDQAVLHTDPGFPMSIGDGVSIGHGAELQGCSIGSGTLIGVGAVVLNGAEIGESSLIAAGAFVGEGKRFPPRSLLLGAPAKMVRELTDAEVARIIRNGEEYVLHAVVYRATLERLAAPFTAE